MCWNFITSSPLPKLNEKKMKKITTEAQIKLHLPDIREDNCTNADCCSFRQHIAKPHVGGWRHARVSCVSFGMSLPFCSTTVINSTKGLMVSGLLLIANRTMNFKETLSRFCWFFRFLSKVMITSKPLKAANPKSSPFFFPNHCMSLTVRTSCLSPKS